MFNCKIKHKPGQANGNAGYLSRYPHRRTGKPEEEGVNVISQHTATPVNSELVKLDVVSKEVGDGATEVTDVGRNIQNAVALRTALPQYSTEQLISWQKEDVHINEVVKITNGKVRIARMRMDLFKQRNC